MNPILFLTPYLVSILLAAGMGFLAVSRRDIKGANTIAALAFSQAFTLVAYVVEINVIGIDAKIYWDSAQWITTSIASIAYFIFALQFTNIITSSTRKFWTYLLIFPVIYQILDLTNAFHSFTRLNSAILESDPFTFLLYDYTPLAYLETAGIIILPVVGIAILIDHLFTARAVYRSQTIILIAAAIIPLLGTFLLFFLPELVYANLMPYSFAASNIFFAFALFRFKLFDVVPMARGIVVESLPEAVVVLDIENRVIDLNHATEKLLNTTKDATIGNHIIQVFQQINEVTQRFIDVNQALVEMPLEINGEKKIVELEIAPINDDKGVITGRVIILRDVTEQREAVKTMVEAKQIAEEARAVAEQANQMKTDFMAGMSHELRTPLNAILTFSELMGNETFGPVTEEQKDYLGKTLQSGQHLLELINDILDIAKIQAGMMVLFLEDDFDVNNELKIVIDMVEQMLIDKPVKLIATIDPEFPPLTCDKRRVRQILLNLLNNAAKFTEEGAIALTAALRENDILFTVSDSGPGIPEDELETIFTPYVQTLSGMQENSGSGLGLPISRDLAQAHGGKLWVESKVGNGTTFYVTIPLDLRPS